MIHKNPVNKLFLINILVLAVTGFFVFLSASMGLLAKDDIKYTSIITNQIFFGFILGGIIFYINSKINYKFWKKYSFWLWIASIFLTLLVFIPYTGLEFAGAKRWILIGPISFQPSEILKIFYIIFLATWLSVVKNKIKTFRYGTLPFIIITFITVILLLFQPDNDTAFVILLTGMSMYFVGGANLKHFAVVIGFSIILLVFVLLNRPYVLDRIQTFMEPTKANIQSTGYQVHQSLIAIGSGGLGGRGFGKSLQKFDLLPEPVGDSIFAVLGEEFGFVGAFFIVLLFISFLFQSLKIGMNTNDLFGGLLMVGFGIMIVSQSFINMASMLGIFPLSGLPLLFISHGGTALFFTFFSVGIMLNISRINNQNQQI
ncbi:MAG TPA: FtsW/RodA/SpoVE family cell cycle protein [Candidatus Paceibacterota bacterium]|nr:FtsW/RodA/SpoVE family cell cycle protein [Candidatus Paceibacterota bacterium]HMP18737.1 FtsW/RodA/SpoVE family cell cycle protein [Candidatus Paceibacterota bacterium]HMP85256.1 FtsW/RodA/SpoVE family cell cycle protein [Candidatus Paceibacterota bacterium]